MKYPTLTRILAAQEAPRGAKVVFKGMPYTKGMTDQPTWIPERRTNGFVVMIPMEDTENWKKIEKAWADAQKPLDLNSKDALKVLKAPASEKQNILDKIRKKASR